MNVVNGGDMVLLRLAFDRPDCPCDDALTCPFIAAQIEHDPNWPQ